MKAAATALPEGRQSKLVDLLALTKPRLNSLVVITTGISYYLGLIAPMDASGLLHTIIGTALVAGGASVLNQVAESDLDETMLRTRKRPIPAGRIEVPDARVFGLALATAGLSQLLYFTNFIAGLVALTTVASYILLYTPLKRTTPWSTLIGAFPGGLPAVLGWTAARGTITFEALILFAIVFFWQLPHFHALSWVYREDFVRAKLPVLAAIDPTGKRTGTHALTWTIVLIPISLLPLLINMGGFIYLVFSTILNVIFLVPAVRFALQRTTARARLLFHMSLIYLPCLWILLVTERAFK
tara:strand:- start:3534 stop:4430 length:897 start_codon:yes stop_codon:yes gene_type:complete